MRAVLGDLLRDAARRHPDGTAVVDGASRLTYRELDERTDRLARLLADLGVGRGDRVGIFLDKSAHAVVGLWGVLKAGAAYVPIDAQSPVARAGYIAGNCRVRCLITASGSKAAWPELVRLAPSIEHVIVLDADTDDLGAGTLPVVGAERLADQIDGPSAVSVLDQDVAYILYTSGSTGEPKGVTLTHRNAMAFVTWAAEEFAIGPSDRLSSHAPFHFDLSVFDLFAAAWGAATLVLVPRRASVFPSEIAKFMRNEQITVWYSVPSILTTLTTQGAITAADVPSLRTLLFAGEVFPTKHLRTLMSLLPGVRFANLFGPTETNVCTWYDVPPLPVDMVETIPIGRAITNDHTYVVTEDGTLAKTGEAGELYVRGATVMRGYWADPERTERLLVTDPFAAAFPDPVYRTGDLVREDEDGNLRYLGRRDAQIKSRGYRIELGEIEAAIDAHPDITECAVVAIPDDLITNRIKAFVVGGADERELVKYCNDRIPKYMIPQTFEFRTELPKTSNGKTDRRALQAAEV